MKTPLKLKHMEMNIEIIVTILIAFFSGSSVGIVALINQAKKNTSFDQRLQVVEDERQDIHDIKEKITEIQINNARYFAIMEANQKNLESVTTSITLIHARIDTLVIPGG